MQLEQIQCEVSHLLNAIDDHPEDARELYAKIHAKLDEVRRAGAVVPEQLRYAERQLETTMCALSQGR